jgi:hypothetical protein
MKVKELMAMLQKMDPEMDLTMYIGGEEWYHDFALKGVEHYDEECATIHFILDKTEGWKIQEELNVEEFCNTCDCIGYGSIYQLDYEEQLELYQSLQDLLADDDGYNEDYTYNLRCAIEDELEEDD